MAPALLSLRRLPSRLRRAWYAEVRARARRRPLWRDTILYESFGGNGALDNPEAIFRRLLERPDGARMRHVWALGRGHRAFRREFRGDARVRIVRYRSTAYHRALARAGYLVNNATFPAEWGKRAGQVYLDTWHGTPLKHMGYDMPGGALLSANVVRNFLQADLLLSQSPWMTRTMYLDAYRLDGIGTARILEVGYPRADRQRLDPDTVSRLRASWEVGDRSLVLYAPTWTGEDFSNPRDEAARQLAVVRDLQERLGDRYAVRLKAHQAVHDGLRRHPDARGLLVENDVPTNRVLGVTDHLVTDFSSIFFDYLALDRPLSFLVPPDDPYRSERGAYFDEGELPGATVRSVAELARRILDPVDPLTSRRRAWASRFTGGDDGSASDRAIDALLGPVRPSSPDPGSRASVLVYVGGMRSNGITSSALNLLAALDHDGWDVTALMARPRGTQRHNQALVDPRVRQVFRLGGMTATKLELLRLLRRRRGKRPEPESAAETRLWAEEWRRLVGDARFDVVVDFSGYSRFWTELLLHGPAARRLLWLHNDMAAELHRTGAGRRPIHRSLPSVLAALPRFDAAVSVSPRLTERNRENLGRRYGMPAERFVTATNLVDTPRVLRGARVPLTELPEFLAPDEDPPGQRRIPEWVAELRRTDLFWFVTVGRLSPEKNQGRLIEAFAEVHRRRPHTRLLLIGDGPYRSRLEKQSADLGVRDAVAFAGRLGNPFPAMVAADVFVLSSDYEGQPMVLLEAATLGLPVITTDFASSRDALPAGYATVVERTAAALADAMVRVADGRGGARDFDAAAYNRGALALVEEVLRGGSSNSASSSISSPTSARAAVAAHSPAPISATPSAMPSPIHIAASDHRDP